MQQPTDIKEWYTLADICQTLNLPYEQALHVVIELANERRITAQRPQWPFRNWLIHRDSLLPIYEKIYQPMVLEKARALGWQNELPTLPLLPMPEYLEDRFSS